MKKLTIALSTLIILMMISIVWINFDEVAITGRHIMSTRLVVISLNESFCDFYFEQGWNLISFPCIAFDMDIDQIFSFYNGTYQSIRYYDASDSNDPWKTYNPNLPSWVVHDLPDISRAEGYWINIDYASSFYLNSSLATPTIIDLSPGWNLIGYPSRTEQATNNTFDEIIPNFDYVYLYNASEADWKQWTWNSSLQSDQDLNYTVLYYGYWIYMLTSDTLTIT